MPQSEPSWDPYMSVQNIAELLNVSTTTARRMIHDNNWPFIETAPGKPGSLMRVRASIVQAWLAGQEARGERPA